MYQKDKFKLGYIILAHNRADLLNKLIVSLSVPNVYFFIHIDKKCYEDFSFLKKYKNIIYYSKSYNVNWGDISIVNTVISLCKYALSSPFSCDYYILLSGHDYPLKSAIYIYNFFKDNYNKNYTLGYTLPTNRLNWIDGGLLRLHGFSLKLNNKKIATILPRCFSITNFRQLIKVIRYNPNKIFSAFSIWCRDKRQFPYDLIPYGGEMWFRMNRNSLVKIISFIDSHPLYYEFMKDVTIPDEVFFNTLLWNLADENINNNLTYIKWTGKSSPANIEDKAEILELIKASDFLFARKFDSIKILDFIDNKL